jgi:hypothetical protein
MIWTMMKKIRQRKNSVEYTAFTSLPLSILRWKYQLLLVLTTLHSKHQSQGRLEEAVTVSKLIGAEKAEDEDKAKVESGYHNDT